MPTRRRLMQAAALSPLAAAPKETALPDASIYTRIGVQPVINGMGTVTMLGGSLMPPEVIRAMNEAARHFIPLAELQKKVGARIAELLNVSAALVTCGAASSIAVAAAACMSRGDHKRLEAMPETSGGTPFEVIQQKSHRSGYEAQMYIQGARSVWVETPEDVARAVSPRTAMMFFLNKNDGDGRIKWQEWVALAKKHNVPSFNDAAADVPPKENLWKYVQGGFDLVAFSGGKGLMGPQASGLLLGRADLIDAARQCISPSGGVGRGMKVGKEEMMGLLAAVELFLKTDYNAVTRDLDRKVSEMTSMLSKVGGLKLSRVIPEIANAVPHLKIQWDEQSKSGVTAQKVLEKLRAGTPAIHLLSQGKGSIMVSVWLMRGAEHRVVAERLADALRTA